MEARFRRVIRGFFPILVLMAVQMVASVIASFVVAFRYMTSHNIMNRSQMTSEVMDELMDMMSSSDANIMVGILYALIGIALFGFWYYKARTHMRHDNFKGYHIAIVPGLLMLAVALQFLTEYILEVISLAAPGWVAEYEVLMEQMGMTENSTPVGLAIYAVLLAPVVEELCFRGLTYSYLRSGMSMWSAIVIQALLFAGFHGNSFQASYTIIFGLFMGYIYAKTENIFLTIALHIGYNLIAVFASQWIYLGSNAISFYCILLTTMVACYIGVLMVTRSVPQLSGTQKK